MMLDNIIEEGLLALAKLTDVSYRIDNIILGKSIYTMKDSNKVFKDMNICLIILEQGYGFAYFQSEIDFKMAEGYVDQDLRRILKKDIPIYLKVALTDAIYSIINNKMHRYNYKYLSGDLRTKAKLRAKELMKNVPKKSKCILLGAVTEIIDECAKKDINLSVLDLEPSKIGLTFNGKKVENSDKVFKTKIKESDYVISTGMIFVTDTADSLFDLAKTNSTKLILYMQTGSNFGGALIKRGAYKVMSEFFPYYDFNGDTRYIIHSK